MKVTISIDTERCKGCEFCVSVCPHGVLKMTTQLNSNGLHFPEITDPDKCTGCQLCAQICPDAAIELEEEN